MKSHIQSSLRSGRRVAAAAVIAAAMAGAATALQAGQMTTTAPAADAGKNPAPPAEVVRDPSAFWDLFTLYKNKENPFIQEISLTGRFQYQYANVWSAEGDADEGEIRRWRAGAKVKFLDGFTLAGEINITEEEFYDSIDVLDLSYKFCDAFVLSIGKMKPEFTYEYTTSSKKILTFERSLLVNNVVPDKLTGIQAEGEIGKFSYAVAGFAGDEENEFSEFDEGYLFLAKLGYDLSEETGLDEFGLHLDYIYNADEENSGLAANRNLFSLSAAGKQGKFGFLVDLIYADGYENSKYGIVLMPTYMIIKDKLELVTRYQFAHGDDDSLRLQSRYERIVPNLTDSGYGDTYNAVYVGLNYYIVDHRLKLMTGIEYSNMDGGGDGGDFDGWTWFNGVRFYF